MAFLIIIWLVAGTIGCGAAIRKWQPGEFHFPFALGGLFIIVVGSVLGLEFFHIDKGPIPITIDRVLHLGLLALFAVLCLRRRETVRAVDASDFVLGAMLIWLAFSAITTDWSYANNRPLARLIFFYAMPISLYFVIKNSRIGVLELKLVTMGLVAFCFYLGLTAVFESRGWYGLVFPAYIRNPANIEFLGRGRGPFLNPVSNGIFLTTGLAAALLIWWQSRWKLKAVMTVAIPVIVLGAYATLTRSVWVGLAAGVGLIFWLPASRRQRAVMTVAAACGAMVMLLALGSPNLNFKRDKHVTVEQMSQSAQLRPIFAAVAWEMFLERPVLGCGFGQYGRSRMEYVKEPNSKYELRRAASYLQHNILLSFLTETGLVGCTLLLLLFARIIQVSWLLWRDRSADSWSRSHSLIMIATLTAYLINGMFHDVSIIPMANMLLLFMLAIVANLQANAAMVPVATKTVSGWQTEYGEAA